MPRQPHDGAQTQMDDGPQQQSEDPATSTSDSTGADRAATPAPQPVVAAPGKPDGEVDTRR